VIHSIKSSLVSKLEQYLLSSQLRLQSHLTDSQQLEFLVLVLVQLQPSVAAQDSVDNDNSY